MNELIKTLDMKDEDLFNNNLNKKIEKIDLFGNITIEKSIKKRIGFLPTSVWRPNWQITKRLKKLVGDSSQTRESLNSNRSDRRNGVNNGKPSIFNPNLCQMILSAYCDENSTIYDPFAGGGTRAIISSMFGHKYYGVEIRKEEVDRINIKKKELDLDFTVIKGDALNKNFNGIKFNFSLTCPPYYDLEQYSNLDNDLSNQKDYKGFLKMLSISIKRVYDCLEDGSLSVWVVGNFRNKFGALEHLNGDLIRIGKENGFILLDELIYEGASKVALTRCSKFEKNRKSIRMHEYIVIFKKTNKKLN